MLNKEKLMKSEKENGGGRLPMKRRQESLKSKESDKKLRYMLRNLDFINWLMKQLKKQQESRKSKMMTKKNKDRERLELLRKNKKGFDLKELNTSELNNSVSRRRQKMKKPKEEQPYKV